MAFRQLFLLTAVINAVTAVLVALLLKEPPRSALQDASSQRANVRWILGDWRMRFALPGLMLAMAGVAMTMPIFPLYVEDLLGDGIDPKVVTGIGFAVVAACTLLGSSFLGTISHRIGLKTLLVTALGLASISLALHPFVHSITAMLAVRALLGLAVAGVGPVLHAMISRAAPDGMRGGVTGYANSATILGFFVGPMAGGWMANHVGVHGVFLVGAAVTAGCAAGAAMVARRVGRDRTIPPLAEDMPR
jgi:MFS family permease